MIARILRWAGGSLAALLLVGAAGLTWVYLASEARLHSYSRPPAFTTPVPAGPESIARGEHLVQTRGCAGCHGARLAGQQMWGYAVALNLPAYVQEHDIVVFEAAFRHGIGADGAAFYSMPSYNFRLLRDADVADIYAYLHSLPIERVPLPAPNLTWERRWNLARGTDKPIAGFLSLVPPLRRTSDADPRMARGEYLAMTTCNECHGMTLRGDMPWPDDAPDLIVIAGYDEAAFTHLMRTGLALGERELPMMSGVARGRFTHFSDEEVRDLYAFLSQLAAQAAAAR